MIRNESFRSPAARTAARRMLASLLRRGGPAESPRRGRLLLESLEKRQLLAGDMELLFTDGNSGPLDAPPGDQASEALATALPVATAAEGEPAPDLVQFAKDLSAAGVQYFGAYWCPACTQQKELFEDGQNELPFFEVTNPDRTLNALGQAEAITQFPTWKFPDGTVVSGVQSLAQLSALSGLAIPQSEQPIFEDIGNQTVRIGSPLHIPVDAYDPDGGPLTVSVSVADPGLLQATVLNGNRSIRIDMQGYGDMVFELFEQRAPGPSGRVATLANDGFYDGIIFHRVVDNFVIQAGDPTGTGTSGSELGNFDDQFHPDLQHNRSGVLSFAKTSDDTNNSQFFITETPTRHLDFNHSIFGQLVEGEEVREAISETAVDGSDRPLNPVRIETIEVFNDTENSVVMLKAAGSQTGTTSVTFTVTDQDGNSFSETITVNVVADTAVPPRESENSQPFLNPIATPSPTATGTTATLQLTSIDIEGDPVTYFAQAISSNSNGSVTVNPDTGLVSVTPAAGFDGTFDVLVGVRRSQPNSFQTSDQDTQRVSFAFEGQQTIPAPTAIDLQTASDTGVSNLDNLTAAGSLSFTVSGVTGGATVELVDTDSGNVVGTGVATGSTVTITTNNIAALGDGTYPLAARQRVGNEVSDLSPTLTLVYDSTPPDSVIASAATSGNLGRLYETDLISTEEGSGLVYALVAAPTGATINATTGVIAWTPIETQLGENTFTINLTDAAGNTRTESFTVSVAGEPLAEVRLDLTDLQGNPISTISVGQQFLLNMVAVDARLFSRPGVFAAYADVLFDSDLIRPVPGSTITFSDDFTVQRKGSFAPGLINELGAVSNVLQATSDPENLIATIRMEALASGTVNIRSEPADESDSEFLLYFEDDRLPAEAVLYGSTTLAIGQNFTLSNDTITVAEDSGTTTIDVLANDQVLSGAGGLTVVAVSQPASGGSVTLSGGEVRFTPAADFHGTAVFTYRASGSGGVQDEATVTVTVTPVNDPPTAVNDQFTVEENSTDNTLDVLGNDLIAPDSGESLSITSVGASAAGGVVTISSDGQSVRYIPPTGFTGPDSFTYTMSDGGLTATATATVTVVAADAPPTAVADPFVITEDDAEASFDVLSNDLRDTDNQPFTIIAVGTPSHGGNVSIGGDGTELRYQPAANFNGTETVSYTIRDTGGGIAVGTVTFTVAAVNDPPPVADITATLTRGSGESAVHQIGNLPANPDSGETLTFSAVSTTTTAGGTARIDANAGTILYTPPAADFTGTDSLTFTVADGTGLVSSGIVNINVADFTERDIVVQLPAAAARARVGGIMLVGTDLLGANVEMPLLFTASGARFDDVLPGNYRIEVPAIPFLQNGEQPTQISLLSAASDGDTTVDLGLGRLRPEFISIRDWLGSTPQQNVLVAVAPGQASVLTMPSPATTTIDALAVELDSAGEALTIRGRQNGTNGSAAADVEASLPTSGDPRVQLRGQAGGMRLYRINVEDADTFSPATSGGEGEAPPVAPLIVGDLQAEGEAPAAAAVSRADLFVPRAADRSDGSDLLVLNTPESDLWISAMTEPRSAAGGGGDGNDDASTAVDQAMQSVGNLSIEIAGGDRIAAPLSLEQPLIDAALLGGL